MLAKRPLQCYRCGEFGHVRFSCKAKIDRKESCYNCGDVQGHSARMCKSEEPRCIVCEEKGYPLNHRIGSRACKLDKISERTRQLPRRRMVEGSVEERREELETYREEEFENREEEERMDYKDEL